MVPESGESFRSVRKSRKIFTPPWGIGRKSGRELSLVCGVRGRFDQFVIKAAGVCPDIAEQKRKLFARVTW